MSEKRPSGDLTEGPIFKVLSRLALPIMASSFLSTAYNITDMAWIGMLGADAVAGVGVGGMYSWLSQGLSALTRMGGQVYVAQSLGRGQRREAGHYARAAVQMVIGFGLLFGLISLLFTGPLVGFFWIEDAVTVGYARVYMKITCGLILFSYINYTLTGLFTAQGDSKTPLKANALGLLVNMVFDPVLILGVGPFPRMEVAGAAVATVGAQAVVMLVMVWEIIKPVKKEKVERPNVLRGAGLFRPSPAGYYRDVLRMGVPTALQTSVYCLISMVLTRMVAVFGSGAVAVQRVGGQIESICWNAAEGFGTAMNAFVGQNFGAAKTGRMRTGYRISLMMVLSLGTAVTLAFLLFPVPISRLFFHETDVIAISAWYLMIVGLSEPFMAVELMSEGAIAGLGKTKLCSAISVTLTGMRIPLAWLLGGTALGLNGIWWALTLSSVCKGIVFYFTFRRECVRSERMLRGK